MGGGGPSLKIMFSKKRWNNEFRPEFYWFLVRMAYINTCIHAYCDGTEGLYISY